MRTTPILWKSISKQAKRGHPAVSVAVTPNLPPIAVQLAAFAKNTSSGGDVVNHGLCDDIISYIGPSLEKYRNCDIIDTNPGAGLWSSKIHDFLKPRRHVLIEADNNYMPFLQPLLDAPDSRYVHAPYNGSTTQSIVSVLQDGLLPDQKPFHHEDPQINQPNTSLLVLLNLSRRTKKKDRTSYFVNRSALNVLQSSAWAHVGLHRFGLIRMLVWVDDYTKERLVPKSLPGDSYNFSFQHHTDTHIVAEMPPGDTPRINTDLDIASAVRTIESMRRLNMELPSHRRNYFYEKALAEVPAEGDVRTIADVQKELQSHLIPRQDFVSELEKLEAELAAGRLKRPYLQKRQVDVRWDRLKALQTIKPHSLRSRDLAPKRMEEALALGDKINQLELVVIDESKPYNERLAAKQELEEATANFKKAAIKHAISRRKQLTLLLDNRKAFYSDPPYLMWDRRRYEPLRAEKEEFFPVQELALLDVNPKPAPRKYTENDLKYWQRFVDRLYSRPSLSIRMALDSISLGAANALLPQLSAVHDPRRGGSLDVEEMRVRNLTPEMIDEIVSAWKNWDDRPQTIEDELMQARLDWWDLAEAKSEKMMHF